MADELGSVDEIGLVDDIGLERATADPIGLFRDGLEASNSSENYFGSTTDEQGKEIDSRPRLGGLRMEVDSDLKRMEMDSDLKRMEVDSDLGIEGRTAGPGNQTKEGSYRHRHLLSVLTSSKREEKRLRSVICRSLLLPIASAIVLWFSRGDPLLVVWRLSLILCYGCLFWTNFLIQTLGRGTVFMYITYGLLLAVWADSMLNPAMGALIVHLNSHFATGLLGYALAERLQRQGIERSAFDVPIPTSHEEVKRLHVLRFLGGLVLAGPILGVAGGMLWLVWHSADYAADELVMDTLIFLPAALLFGIVIVAMFQLRGALISVDHIAFVMLYFIFVTFLRAICKEVLDNNVVGIIITWFAVLALSGVLGYCVSVLASFKRLHIVRSKAYMAGDDQGS